MSTATSGLVTLFGHDPLTYCAHAVHIGQRTYNETNCYMDVVVELLHARGDEPRAAFGATVRMDFEGDQWMFFKPHPEDLERLFGIDVHEMQPYRPLPVQIAELIAAGRTLIVELDAWHLPDTAATSYRREHVKTSVAAEAIDVAGERLRYFHNAGLYELAGEDYRGALRVGDALSDDVLAPYTEIVRFDAGPRRADAELRAAAHALLRRHLARRPATNPFHRFGERLAADMPALLDGDAEDFHAYAFATVRMAGAGFELCADHVDWLLGARGLRASTALAAIVDGSKLLGFKLARRRPFDPQPALDALAEAWDTAMLELDEVVG
jgi:hypothetical protein